MIVDVSIPIHLAKSHELKLRIKLYKIENIHSVVESAQMILSNSWNIPQNTPHSRTQMHYIQIHKTSFFSAKNIFWSYSFLCSNISWNLPTFLHSQRHVVLSLSSQKEKKREKIKIKQTKKENKIKDTQTKQQTYYSRLCAMQYRQNTRQGVQNNFYKFVRGF